jgi:hypothetical protein
MARLNIEEDAWSRIHRLSKILKIPPEPIAGHLAFLWHQSQSLMRISGTREEIIDWLGLIDESDEIKDHWLTSLQRVHFISGDDRKFVIHGNESQIDNLVKKRSAGAKGAEKTKSNWAKLKALEAQNKSSEHSRAGCPSMITPEPQQDQAQGNAMQFNAEQSNSNQCSSSTASELTKVDQQPSEAMDPEAATTSAPDKIGVIHPELKGDYVLDQVLPVISLNTQKRWLKKFNNASWLRHTLSKAVDHYQAKADQNSETVSDWGLKLTTWLNREKNPPAPGSSDPFAFLEECEKEEPA